MSKFGAREQCDMGPSVAYEDASRRRSCAPQALFKPPRRQGRQGTKGSVDLGDLGVLAVDCGADAPLSPVLAGQVSSKWTGDSGAWGPI
jgi:hypothetical protein